MGKLVLIGGGGHCRSIIDAIYSWQTPLFDEIVITDSELPIGSDVLGVKVFGGDDALSYLFDKGFSYAFISVGSIKDATPRRNIYSKIKNIGYNLPIIQDISAVVAGSASIDEGSFIGKKAIVNSCASVGKNCIINSGAIIEHDCVIEDFCHVSSGTILCGAVTCKEGCFVGAGSVVMQGITIGENSVIGCGSTVLTDIRSNMLKYGVIA